MSRSQKGDSQGLHVVTALAFSKQCMNGQSSAFIRMSCESRESHKLFAPHCFLLTAEIVWHFFDLAFNFYFKSQRRRTERRTTEFRMKKVSEKHGKANSLRTVIDVYRNRSQRREQGTGGTGNGERESGNEVLAVMEDAKTETEKNHDTTKQQAFFKMWVSKIKKRKACYIKPVDFHSQSI